MSWNYRVVRSDEGGEVSYTIREAFYEADGRTLKAITANGVSPGGSTLVELQKDVALMMAAFDKAPLRETDVPQEARPVAVGDWKASGE